MNKRLVIIILSTLLVFMYIPRASQAASVEEAANAVDKSKDSESETKLIGYIFKITSEYFAQGLGWPVALVLVAYFILRKMRKRK